MNNPKLPLNQMVFELALDSWHTMVYRMGMIASGTCTVAEYQKMTTEKLVAAQQSLLAAMVPGCSDAAILAPWHRAAAKNAKRLRRR